MGLKDIFNASKIRKENDSLKEMMSTDMKEAADINALIIDLEAKRDKTQKECDALVLKVEKLKKDAVFFEDAIIFQEYGLYTPRYSFVTAQEYKDRLNLIRDKQKQMIKNDKAINGAQNWTVNGSKSKGNKMIKDLKKLFLRAFNSDCEDAISHVKYSNYEMSEKKIRQSAETIGKLGSSLSISISGQYMDLKVEELALAFEYQMKKQEEKEALKEARAEQREAQKLAREIEEQRKKLEKEQTHYEAAFSKVLKQLEETPDDQNLIEKRNELEAHLRDIDKAMKDVDYREANQRAGYVYVISNIGAFGENVYKIGMTRRLEPQDRVDELGSASVPFNFDVHAMIFSDDAPALEAALHRAFEDRKVNMVNPRREFFNVTLDEIKDVVRKNYDKTVEFIDLPDAEQYRMSTILRNDQDKHEYMN